MIFHNSDSTAKDIVSYDGSIAAFYMDGGNDTFVHLHPSVVQNGSIVAAGTGNFEGTEIDDVGGYGFEILEPFTGEGVSITGTNGYVGGNRFLNGSAMFYLDLPPQPQRRSPSAQPARSAAQPRLGQRLQIGRNLSRSLARSIRRQTTSPRRLTGCPLSATTHPADKRWETSHRRLL